jgi:hypothetical protein
VDNLGKGGAVMKKQAVLSWQRRKKGALARTIGARYQCGKPKGKRKTAPEGYIDSPVIYGDRVETSNPYHLVYIERVFNLHFKSISLFGKSQLFFL